MSESEYALHDAAESRTPRKARIAQAIIDDHQKYREWELRHAKLLQPVAEEKAAKSQIRALRRADVQLVHRRAFFTYLQARPVKRRVRERLFRLFHASLDLDAAILAEHRQYMLAYSSGISTDHIIDVMHDSIGAELLQTYEKLYTQYFELKCYLATLNHRSLTSDLVRSTLRDVQNRLHFLRRQIESNLPSERNGDFEHQELLARSGRYKIQNYLIA